MFVILARNILVKTLKRAQGICRWSHVSNSLWRVSDWSSIPLTTHLTYLIPNPIHLCGLSGGDKGLFHWVVKLMCQSHWISKCSMYYHLIYVDQLIMDD